MLKRRKKKFKFEMRLVQKDVLCVSFFPSFNRHFQFQFNNKWQRVITKSISMHMFSIIIFSVSFFYLFNFFLLLRHNSFGGQHTLRIHYSKLILIQSMWKKQIYSEHLDFNVGFFSLSLSLILSLWCNLLCSQVRKDTLFYENCNFLLEDAIATARFYRNK